MPSIFDVRAGFNVDASHIFPQCVLATITLIIGVMPCVGGPEACMVSGGTSSLLSGSHHPARGQVSSQVARVEAPRA